MHDRFEIIKRATIILEETRNTQKRETCETCENLSFRKWILTKDVCSLYTDQYRSNVNFVDEKKN